MELITEEKQNLNLRIGEIVSVYKKNNKIYYRKKPNIKNQIEINQVNLVTEERNSKPPIKLKKKEEKKLVVGNIFNEYPITVQNSEGKKIYIKKGEEKLFNTDEEELKIIIKGELIFIIH